jgi:hypothetical protein
VRHSQITDLVSSTVLTDYIGKVLNLGADWRLTDKDGKIRPDARYNIQTDDGTWIYVQTEGPTQADGRTLLRGKFETATNGTYNWLNDVVAVGVLTRNGTEGVIIDMWQVTIPFEEPIRTILTGAIGITRLIG